MADPAETDNPAPIEVVDEAASVLRERIFTGRYRPGDSLRQERLAAELRIGRTPTREALRLLEQEGLVQAAKGRGARVVARDARRLIAACDVRAVLDGLAASLAAARPGRRDWLPYLDRTLAAQRRLIEEPDARGYAQLAADFHVAIRHMSDNKFLISQAGLIRLSLQVLGADDVLDAPAARRAVRERHGIRDAIASGRPEEAEALARRHVQTQAAALKADLNQAG